MIKVPLADLDAMTGELKQATAVLDSIIYRIENEGADGTGITALYGLMAHLDRISEEMDEGVTYLLNAKRKGPGQRSNADRGSHQRKHYQPPEARR